MALGGTYNTGKAGVTVGSTAVTGHGVLWSGAVEGDTLQVGAAIGKVDSVGVTFDSITLKDGWAGPTVPQGTATITIASPGVVTWPATAPPDGTPVLLSTTGALPTGLVAGTIYYCKSPSGSTSNLAATSGGAAINTSGTQSGTHTIGASYRIYYDSVLRFDPALTQAKVRNLINLLETSAVFGVPFMWDVGTSDADPGAGNIRASDPSLASAAFLYISKTSRAGADVSAFLAALDDSTSASSKGILILGAQPEGTQAIFSVGAVTDATGYIKLAISNPSGVTTFVDGDLINFQFVRAGDGRFAADTITGANLYTILDKTLVADNAGLWFKQGGTSLIRAGLFGDNDYGIEYLVSSTWTRAIKVASATGIVTLPNTTDASALGTAAVVLAGGLSVAKQSWFGGWTNIRTASGSVRGLTVFNNSGAGGTAVPVELAGAVSAGTFTDVWGHTSPRATLVVSTAYTGTGGYLLALVESSSAALNTVFLVAANGQTNISGNVSIASTTASTSTTTGALVVGGGVGIAGDQYLGGILRVAGHNTTFGPAGSQGSRVNISSVGSASAMLDIDNTSAGAGGETVVYFRRNTSTVTGSISNTDSATAFNTSSDIRGKPNRELLDLAYARSIVNQIRIWDFNKDGNAIRGVGVIAQEAYEVSKYFATPGRTSGEWWQAEKAAPVPYLIAAQQLTHRVTDDHERRIAALEAALH